MRAMRETKAKSRKVKIIKRTALVLTALMLAYIFYTVGYLAGESDGKTSLAAANKTNVEKIAAKDKEIADKSKAYSDLLATHNQLVNDVNSGKYTRTQYVNVPTYTGPKYCNTQYYSYLNSASTTCF
jgi:hypothetical protein